MKINNTERKILKFLFKNSNFNNKLNLDTVKNNFLTDEYNFMNSINKLYEMKLIDGSYNGIFITDDGKEYFRNKRINIIKYIITSVIIPIVISYITSYLTTSNNDKCCNDTNNSRTQTFNKKQ